MNTANDSNSQEEPRREPAEALVVAARREPAQVSRSRLAPCAEVIFILREKRWSFAAITAWLERRGVQVAESTVQRFYRARHRNPSHERPHPPPDDQFSAPSFNSTYENHQSSTHRSASRPRYNTDF